MSKTYKTADEQYNEIVQNILDNGIEIIEGVRTVYEDGVIAPAKTILNARMVFDNGSHLPLLTTKRVGVKSPILEMLWIWQKMSNKVQDLNDVGVNIWNEWKLSDGTIGNAYGYILANKKTEVVVDRLFLEMYLNNEFSFGVFDKDKTKSIEELMQAIYLKGEEYTFSLNQVDNVLYQLKKNPYSRRIKTNLWAVDEIHNMSLTPCVYDTHFQTINGVLSLTVNVRSQDICNGNPYNIYQYAVLHRMIAQVSGLKVGELCFNLDNVHIYNRYYDKIQEQVIGETHEPPTLWINPNVKSFYEFTIDDFKVENYKHNGNFKYEIAI